MPSMTRLHGSTAVTHAATLRTGVVVMSLHRAPAVNIEQVLFVGHQPQRASAAQVSQPPKARHGSAGGAQSVVTHFHAVPVQAPPRVAPVEVPVRQLLSVAQKPQPARGVQSPHVW